MFFIYSMTSIYFIVYIFLTFSLWYVLLIKFGSLNWRWSTKVLGQVISIKRKFISQSDLKHIMTSPIKTIISSEGVHRHYNKYTSFCRNFFHLHAWKPNIEKLSIYSNKFFHSFHLSKSSFTCPGLWASGLVQRLIYQLILSNSLRY